MDLGACLDQCSLGLLREIAATHGRSISEPPARSEVLRALDEHLSSPGYLQSFLDRLDDSARRALSLVITEGCEIRSFVLERRLREWAGPEGQDQARRTLDQLLRAGLLYRTFRAVGSERGEVFVVADQVAALLPVETSKHESDCRAVDPPHKSRGCSPALCIFALASFMRRWTAAIRSRRREGQLVALEQETEELAQELPWRSSRERWTLFAHLGIQLGLFTREEGGLQVTDRLDDWLATGDAGERRLWSAYVSAEHWNDLERSGTAEHRYAGRLAEPVEARAQLLDLVRVLPRDGWVLVSDLESMIRVRAPDFLREGFEIASSRLVDLQSGEVLGGVGSWERVEAPLVSYLLSGPLFWLGVLEWGCADGQWDRIRITSAGRAWLHGSDRALAASTGRLVLASDLRVVADAAVDLALLWKLEPYLELQRRGPPSEYALTRESFATGLQVGGSPADLRGLLESGAATPLPQAFSAFLETWSVRAGRLRIRPMVVLTADDPELLTSLLRRPDLSSILRERLGPGAAAVAPVRALDLGETLERIGHLPDVDAALRLSAGRKAYAALVDQQTLEVLYFYLCLISAVGRGLASEFSQHEHLRGRLRQALGSVAANRIARRARRQARLLGGRLREPVDSDEAE